MRPAVIRLALVTVTITAAVIVGEVCLRAGGWVKLDVIHAAPNPLFGWHHQPNSRAWSYAPGGRVPVQINSKGLREREIGYEKQRGAFRILALGDSMVEASQVTAQESFTRQLEQRLNEASRGVRFEVINAGMGGYGTDNEVLFFEYEGAKYRADLVVLGFFMANDVYDNSVRLLPVDTPGKPRKPYFVLTDDQLQLSNFPCDCLAPEPTSPLQRMKRFLRLHSALYVLTNRTLVEEFPSAASELAGMGLMGTLSQQRSWMENDGVPLMFENFSTVASAAWQEGWQLTHQLIRELKRRVENEGSRLVIVGIPTREQVHPEQWQDARRWYPKLRDRRWNLDVPERQLASGLSEAGIPYISLLPAFRESDRTSGPRLYFDSVDEAHWNAAGQSLAATMVSNALTQRGYVSLDAVNEAVK